MNILSYAEFRSKLNPTLDSVVFDQEVVFVNRGEQNCAVVISLREYNAMQETMHLLGSKNNAARLYDALERDKKNQYVVHDIIDAE